LIGSKKILAIIPARSGSKGLPGKNIKVMCGKPLIVWSILAAKECSYIDEVMVSTDSPQIADISTKAGAEAPFLRPINLASDISTSFDVVKHVIHTYKSNCDKEFDYVVLLEPTSPLREKFDLDRMIEKIDSMSSNYDAIVSLGQVHEHPSIMKIIEGKKILPLLESAQSSLRRQDHAPVYFPYGVGYVVKTKTLLAEETFYPARTTFYEIKRYQCFEVDDIFDFLAIEAVMKNKWKLT
jgi:CMP-N,N'-diacetyllegionaminic acid synthase